MNTFVLRLQALDGYGALAIASLPTDRFPKVLAVHHTGKKGDNPHYHFCLTTDYKMDALRKMLKKVFTLATGNKHLSLKQWDGGTKALSYLFHEGTDVFLNTGYTEEEIDEYKTQNDVVQSKMVKGHMVVDVVVDFFVQAQKSEGTPLHRNDKRAIFYKVLDVYNKSGEWLPNRFQAERLTLRVRQKLVMIQADAGCQAAWQMFQNDLFNDYFPHG